MSNQVHPAAPHHMPFFLPGPDGSDPLPVGTAIQPFNSGVIALLRVGTRPSPGP